MVRRLCMVPRAADQLCQECLPRCPGGKGIKGDKSDKDTKELKQAKVEKGKDRAMDVESTDMTFVIVLTHRIP